MRSTMKTEEDQNRYLKARRRVRELKKFYLNILTYTVFIIFLAAVNYYVNELRPPWFLWAALGWGIGLFFQGMKVFKNVHFFGKEWEERKIRKLMDKDESDQI